CCCSSCLNEPGYWSDQRGGRRRTLPCEAALCRTSGESLVLPCGSSGSPPLLVSGIGSQKEDTRGVANAIFGSEAAVEPDERGALWSAGYLYRSDDRTCQARV